MQGNLRDPLKCPAGQECDCRETCEFSHPRNGQLWFCKDRQNCIKRASGQGCNGDHHRKL